MEAGEPEKVRETNDDASISKFSTVRAGYYSDWALNELIRAHSPTSRRKLGGLSTSQNLPRRAPAINRGYFLRVEALRRTISSFFRCHCSCSFTNSATATCPAPDQPIRRVPVQILSLGAGFDTTLWWLLSCGVAPAAYVEVDYSEVVQRKWQRVEVSSSLSQFYDSFLPPFRWKNRSELVSVGEAERDWDVFELGVRTESAEHSACYVLAGCDLSNIASLQVVVDKFLDASLPTLVISECSLIYLAPENIRSVLSLLPSLGFSDCAAFIYEQIRPDDAFGRTMIQNLVERGCPLRGILDAPSCDAQKTRLRECGWPHALAIDMHEFEKTCVDTREKDRMRSLEWMDEWEEYTILMQHYCIAIGASDELILSAVQIGLTSQPILSSNNEDQVS